MADDLQQTADATPDGPAPAGALEGSLVPSPASRLRPPWRPGESGNPSGRPRGLVQAVRRRAGHDGRKLVEGLWAIAFGTPKQRREVFGERVKVSSKERLLAISELLDRGWGKPSQSVDVTSVNITLEELLAGTHGTDGEMIPIEIETRISEEE